MQPCCARSFESGFKLGHFLRLASLIDTAWALSTRMDMGIVRVAETSVNAGRRGLLSCIASRIARCTGRLPKYIALHQCQCCLVPETGLITAVATSVCQTFACLELRAFARWQACR